MSTLWHQLEQGLNQGEFTLSSLKEDYDINANWDESLGLVCLKYGTHSPKTHWLTRACRGTVLSLQNSTWKVEAAGFERFFNLGEVPKLQAKFDWGQAVVETKWDGSLIKLYHYGGEWRVSTSGTPTGQTPVNNGYGGTFAELFWQCAEVAEFPTWGLKPEFVYVYELITPYNRIVVDYGGKWMIRLLTIRSKYNWEEILPPMDYGLLDCEELVQRLSSANGLDTEGYILRDIQGNRIKLKCPHYISLHRAVSNGEPDWRSLIENEEWQEFVLYFPSFLPRVEYILGRRKEAEEEINILRTLLRDKYREGRKEFALEYNQHPWFGAVMAIANGKVSSPTEFFQTMTPKRWKERFL